MEQTPHQQILAKCKEMVVKAKELYNLDLSAVPVSFNLRGRCAGVAQWRINRSTGTTRDHAIKFNRDMLGREAFGHVLNNTVPHEYAHIVCVMNPRLGRNHDAGWERVCIALGGSGSTRHKEDVVYGKGSTYEYTTDTGKTVRMSDRYHARIQAGGTLRYKKGLGVVTKSCAYTIVGHRGSTFAAPIVVKEAAPAPSVLTSSWVINARQPVDIMTMVPATVPRQYPVARPAAAPAPQAFTEGTSKAAKSRSIMAHGYRAGHTYDAIINAMMLANGYNRQLARATFKANSVRVSIPDTWGN